MGESRMVCLLMNEAAIWWKLYIMTFPRPCPLSFALDLRRTGAGTLRDRTFRTRPATRPSTPPKAAPPRDPRLQGSSGAQEPPESWNGSQVRDRQETWGDRQGHPIEIVKESSPSTVDTGALRLVSGATPPHLSATQERSGTQEALEIGILWSMGPLWQGIIETQGEKDPEPKPFPLG